MIELLLRSKLENVEFLENNQKEGTIIRLSRGVYLLKFPSPFNAHKNEGGFLEDVDIRFFCPIGTRCW